MAVTPPEAARPAKSVEVVDPDEGWARAYDAERDALAEALGPAAVAIHHVGSTSVPGLAAKPVVDVLVEASDLPAVDAAASRLEALGYEARGEYGIPGRRYFSRPAGSGPAVHVHAFRKGDPHVERHLRFRDYLRAHPVEAARYGALKRELAAAHARDRASYQAGKADFIRRVVEHARAWDAEGRTPPPGNAGA